MVYRTSGLARVKRASDEGPVGGKAVLSSYRFDRQDPCDAATFCWIRFEVAATEPLPK